MRLIFPKRLLFKVGGIVGLALLVAGCSNVFDRRPSLPCPPIFVLKDAGSLIRYKPGPGQDVIDVVFRGQIVDFRAVCDFEKDRKEVKISLNLSFDLTRGPANRDRQAKFQYFVAIPHFYPASQGRNIFSIDAKFTGRQTRLRTNDEIEMVIPLDPKVPLVKYAVYLGFQLTRAELKDRQREIKQ